MGAEGRDLIPEKGTRSWSRPMSSAPGTDHFLGPESLIDIDSEILERQAEQYSVIAISQPSRGTVNGVKVFKELVYDRRQPDTVISEKVGASQQGVNKKRNQLIESGLLEDRETFSENAECLDQALEKTYDRYLERREPEDYGIVDDLEQVVGDQTYQKVMESHIFDEFSEDLQKISLRGGSSRRIGAFLAKTVYPEYSPAQLSNVLESSELPYSSATSLKKDYQRWRNAGILDEDNRPTWRAGTLKEFWRNHYECIEQLSDSPY